MTDEVIMEAVKNGNLREATLLFERYNKRIFHFLARMTMDRDLAEDLTQNVFLRIIKYRLTYREGASFQAWIYQIARNVFSDHYQSAKNRYSDFVDVEKVQDRMADLDESQAQNEKEALLERSMTRGAQVHLTPTTTDRDGAADWFRRPSTVIPPTGAFPRKPETWIPPLAC